MNTFLDCLFIPVTWQILISRSGIRKFCITSSCSTYILTSQLFSWLQNGQLNTWSRGSTVLRFGGGLLAFFLRPIVTVSESSQTNVTAWFAVEIHNQTHSLKLLAYSVLLYSIFSKPHNPDLCNA